MEIRNIPISRSVGVQEKTKTTKGDFADNFMKSYKSATKEEIENYIKDIKKKGSNLANTQSFADVRSYKNTIKKYLQAVVDYTYTLNKNMGFWENQYYSTVETVNEKLEELTQHILGEEKENIDISSTVDVIQGLLIDIYR